MNGPWAAEYWRLGLLVLLALSVGGWFGITGWAIAAMLGFELVRCLLRLRRFLTWLRHGKSTQPPPLDGIWNELVYAVQRVHQRYRRRKKKMGKLLKRFRESSAAMPDATVILGPSGEIEWFNEAATRLLGFRAPEDAGRQITHLLRYPPFVEYFQQTDYREAVEMPAPHDDEIWLNMRIVPYGKDQSLLAVRDVTRLRRLEKIRQDFVANVSHELRTPLTVITGYLEALKEPDESHAPHVLQSLEQMHAQAERMRRLVDDLLMLARLETDLEGAIEYVPVAMDALVTALQEEAMMASDGNHEIAAQLESRHWLTGVPAELHSAFSNLVSNAVRYTPVGGKIMLRWRVSAHGGHFEVVDNGVGIEVHHIPRLTERFYRAERDRSRATGGTGLGLAIVKHVLQRHGAQLRIESEPGRGSLFACDFPLERLYAIMPSVENWSVTEVGDG